MLVGAKGLPVHSRRGWLQAPLMGEAWEKSVRAFRCEWRCAGAQNPFCLKEVPLPKVAMSFLSLQQNKAVHPWMNLPLQSSTIFL